MDEQEKTPSRTTLIQRIEVQDSPYFSLLFVPSCLRAFVPSCEVIRPLPGVQNGKGRGQGGGVPDRYFSNHSRSAGTAIS